MEPVDLTAPIEGPTGYPKTAAEWWQQAADPRMLDLIRRFHPFYASARAAKMPITAAHAEAASVGIRQEIAINTVVDPSQAFAAALAAKDGPTAIQILSDAWFGAPESWDVHSVPGFGVLCDLCSESELALPEDALFECPDPT